MSALALLLEPVFQLVQKRCLSAKNLLACVSEAEPSGSIDFGKVLLPS